MTAPQLLAPLAAAEARELTERIKFTAEHLWELLLEAHDREAWRALDYPSWRDYATAELGVSQSYAYRVLDQGRVIREIEMAAGFSPMGEISEREARQIKPVLQLVSDDVREAAAAVREAHADAPPSEQQALDDRVRHAVRTVIDDHRQRATRIDEANAAMDELNALAPEGFDASADRAMTHRMYALFNALDTLAGESDPAEVVAAVHPHEAGRLDVLDAAEASLHALRTAWSSR